MFFFFYCGFTGQLQYAQHNAIHGIKMMVNLYFIIMIYRLKGFPLMAN